MDVMHETAVDIYKTKQRTMAENRGDDGKKDIISVLSEWLFRLLFMVARCSVDFHSEGECECDRGGSANG